MFIEEYKKNIKLFFLLISLIASVLMLQACSNKFLYKQLDWIAAAYIESYVSLDEEQSERLLEQLQKSFGWHRKTQLPLYSDLLQTIRNGIDNGLDSSKMNHYLVTVNAFYRRFFNRLVDDLGIMLPTLTESQIKELMHIFSNKNTEYRELYLDKNREELKEQKMEKMTEQFEDWLDDLTEPQKGMLDNFVKKYEWDYEERYQLRLKWQKQLSVLLLQAKNGEKVIEKIKGLNYDNFRNEQAKKIIEQKKQAYIELIISVSKTLSKKQKEHLFEKLDDYNTMFLDLS